MSALIVRSEGLFWDTVDGTLVVCNGVSGRIRSLNTSAALIWTLCDRVSLEDLVIGVAACYAIPPDIDVLTADVERFVISLTRSGFLELREEAAA